MTRAVMAAVICLAAQTTCAEIMCGQDRGTRRLFCVESKALRANGDVRGGPLMTGGPKGVSSSGMKLIVNCRTGITVLQDEDTGINRGGSERKDNPAHLEELFRKVCEAAAPKTDKALRQF
jgi:hypothetical protein